MDATEYTSARIETLSGERATLRHHLGETVRAIADLARMLEAVRYQSGLGKSQWERVERARKVAAESDAVLAETLSAANSRTEALLAEIESRQTKKETA